MAGFKIRTAKLVDVDMLVEHRHMMFEEMSHPSAESLRIADDSYRSWASDMMKRRLLRGYVATAGNGKAAASGCVWLREVQPSPDRPSGMVPYVLSMYTRPEYRRNGLASKILTEATEWARKEGYHKIVLHASTVGRKVYSQLGWKRTWEMEFRYDRLSVPAHPVRGRSLRSSRRASAAT